jgi:hypothetical protein
VFSHFFELDTKVANSLDVIVAQHSRCSNRRHPRCGDADTVPACCQRRPVVVCAVAAGKTLAYPRLAASDRPACWQGHDGFVRGNRNRAGLSKRSSSDVAAPHPHGHCRQRLLHLACTSRVCGGGESSEVRRPPVKVLGRLPTVERPRLIRRVLGQRGAVGTPARIGRAPVGRGTVQ